MRRGSLRVGQAYKLYLLFPVLNIDSTLPGRNVFDKYQVSSVVGLCNL